MIPYVCPWPIPPHNPPVEVLVLPGDPKVDLNIEFCGWTSSGIPMKCECDSKVSGLNP